MQAGLIFQMGIMEGKKDRHNGWSYTESDGVSCYDLESPKFGTPYGQEARCPEPTTYEIDFGIDR